MAYLPQHDPTDVVGRRIVAYFVDSILLGAITFAALAGTKSASYTNAPSDACTILRSQTAKSLSCVQLGSHVYTWESGRIAVAVGLGLLATILDLMVLQGITGASVGKMMLGLRVVDAQGQTCGVGRAIVRWVIGLVDHLCAGLVGLVTVLVTHPHRRIGDMAGGTYVIGTVDVGKPIENVGAQAPAYAYSGAGWTPPAPGTQSWGTPPQPDATVQQPWGAPPPAPPAQQQGWPPPAQPGASAWGAPPAPTPPPPSPAQQPAAPPSWGAPPAPTPPPPSPAQQPAAPPSWGAPPSAQPPPPAPAPPAPAPGAESWWDKVGEDDEPKQ